jgi:hypothetical protein
VVNLNVNKLIVIIFLSLMFNFSSPGMNLTEPRLRHFIEFSQEINKREKDEEIINKKIILYCRLLELQTQVAVIDRRYFFNTS